MEIQYVAPAQDNRPDVERLYREMYAALGKPAPPEAWIENVFQQALSGQRSFWLLYHGDSLVGFADFKVMPYHPNTTDKFARVHDLFIRPAFQRRGFGSRAAQRVLEAAKEQGADSVELNVLPDNAKALTFWKSVGFAIHLVLLRCELNPQSAD